MIRLFAGTANPGLVESVAGELGVRLSRSEVVRFQNSEVRVRIVDDVKDQICVVIQSTSTPTDTNLMELFLFCDALKREEADHVIGVIPYFGYARQDIQHRPGECVSVNVVIRFLEAIGFDKIYTIELHDEATGGMFSIPFKNVSAMPLLASHIRAYLELEVPDPDDIAIISPDQGGIERARKFGDYFFGNPYFSTSVVEKKRSMTKIHESSALELFGEVKGKTAIIVDDIVSSGKTLINAARLCIEKGAKKTLAAIAHPELTPQTTKHLNDSKIEKLFCTDTIRIAPAALSDKLEILSVASVIADELKEPLA